jgi:hypothetical protein
VIQNRSAFIDFDAAFDDDWIYLQSSTTLMYLQCYKAVYMYESIKLYCFTISAIISAYSLQVAAKTFPIGECIAAISVLLLHTAAAGAIICSY